MEVRITVIKNLMIMNVFDFRYLALVTIKYSPGQ
jgi:hypothetical protein